MYRLRFDVETRNVATEARLRVRLKVRRCERLHDDGEQCSPPIGVYARIAFAQQQTFQELCKPVYGQILTYLKGVGGEIVMSFGQSIPFCIIVNQLTYLCTV